MVHIIDRPEFIELYQMQVVYHILKKPELFSPEKRTAAASTARWKFGCVARTHAALAEQMGEKIKQREQELGVEVGA